MKRAYTIALCDILGFKRLVTSFPLDTVVQKPLSLFRKALCHSIHKKSFPSEPPSLDKLCDQSQLGVAWFSDTVVLYTLNDTDEHVRNLVQTVGWLLFETMFMKWTRVRGAIAYGEAYIDPANSIFVGKPIIQAFELEKDQVWSGCAFTESGEVRLQELHEYDAISAAPLSAEQRRVLPALWLTRYRVPLKNGGVKSLVSIDWTLGIHDLNFDFPYSEERNVPNDQDWIQHRDVCEKWKNTREFHREMCRFCNL
jgi:hypothetical protein